MAERERTALKWTIGIISSVAWYVGVKGVILADGEGYDAVEQEWIMSTGQEWAMVFWTIAVVFCAVKIYGKIVKE